MHGGCFFCQWKGPSTISIWTFQHSNKKPFCPWCSEGKASLCGPLLILGPTCWSHHCPWVYDPQIRGGPGTQSIVSWLCSVEAIEEMHLLGFFLAFLKSAIESSRLLCATNFFLFFWLLIIFAILGKIFWRKKFLSQIIRFFDQTIAKKRNKKSPKIAIIAYNMKGYLRFSTFVF